jgi:hypothetical protein
VAWNFQKKRRELNYGKFGTAGEVTIQREEMFTPCPFSNQKLSMPFALRVIFFDKLTFPSQSQIKRRREERGHDLLNE